MVRLAACLWLFLPFQALPLLAQAPGVPAARATVFIRLVGDLEISRGADQPGGERHLSETNLELSTGSGALISPVGHILTAAHVVTVESGMMTLGGIRVEVKQTVRRIEVHLPGDDASFPSGSFEATVLAIDPALDLAVVTVNSTNLPFLDLGDSDALGVGDAVEAVGFPFGEQVDIGRPRAAVPVAPAASVSRGNVAAFRGDTQGERRYLQVTAPLNAGNSGGPIVDADGYLVAVANSVIRARGGGGATGVGFGVPVNLAKRFLESYGLDASLRARRTALAPSSLLDGKGLRIPLPLGMSDASPLRTRVDTGSSSADRVTLRVDRVVSPWPAVRIAEALVSGRAFEPFSYSTVPPRALDGSSGRIFLGRATGAMDDGTPARMEYGIIDTGGEKIVARFVGPPPQLAYNASVFRAALRQVEAESMRVAGRDVLGPITWAPLRRPAGRTPVDGVSFPAGWLADASAPFACPGLPSPADAVAASPSADFTIALRAGWFPAAPVGAQEAAAACGTATRDDASYTRDFTFLGTRYHLEGRFTAVGRDGLLQREWVALAEQVPAVRAAVGDWTAR